VTASHFVGVVAVFSLLEDDFFMTLDGMIRFDEKISEWIELFF
jgi:hypothetical protein